MKPDNEHITPPKGPSLADEASFLEDVAALADGSLSEERRAEVLARLADDPDMLDVLAEVTAIQESLDASADGAPAVEEATAPETDSTDQAAEPSEGGEMQPPAKVLRGPWRRRAWAAAATLAAVLALVVVTPRLLSPGPPTPELMITSLDGSALSSVDMSQDLWHVPVNRSGSARESSTSIERLGSRDSFRLGVLETSLVAIIRQDEVEARRALEDELGTIQGYKVFLDLYRDLIQADDPTTRLEEHLQDQELILEWVDPFYYRYGTWIRAAELAASSGQVEFFQGPGGRSLSALTPPDELTEEWRELMRQVRSADDVDDLGPLAERLRSLRSEHAG